MNNMGDVTAANTNPVSGLRLHGNMVRSNNQCFIFLTLSLCGSIKGVPFRLCELPHL